MTLSDICIRSGGSADNDGIMRVHELAFRRQNEGKLTVQLRKAPGFIQDFSIIAELKKTIVGHILLYPVQIVHDESGSVTQTLSLAPLAVLPMFQNLGIGSALVREALTRAAASGYQSVIVLGHPGYYPRFGFRPASRWKIYPPFDVQDNHFMALELIPEGLSRVRGTVQYPVEYDDV